MILTGLEALDSRLGGLRAGGLYSVFGPASAGKSILGLQFLLNGLARGERVLLITREETSEIDSRARYVGYGPGRVSEHPQLRVLRLPNVLPARAAATAAGGALFHWLADHVEQSPQRVVLDDPWLPVSETREQSADLTRFFHTLRATTIALLRADAVAQLDALDRDTFVDRADGVFRLQIGNRGERTFSFHRAPSGSFRTDTFAYAIRGGAGFAEDHPLEVPTIDPADRRRIVVLDDTGVVPLEVLTNLGAQYEVVQLHSAVGALGHLKAGRYGTLVVAVDPFDDSRAFDLVFTLRKEGNAAPIVLMAPSHGLRSTTRSRGLRMGGDDFFVADLPTSEIVERIQLAWTRGAQRRNGLSYITQIVQPVDESGLARPMSESEFLTAMTRLLAEQPPLFFCYLEFAVPAGTQDMVWPALRSRVRIADGDFIGVLSNGHYACVLDRITPEQTAGVVERIRGAHAALHGLSDIVVIASPVHADAIRARTASSHPTLAAATRG